MSGGMVGNGLPVSAVAPPDQMEQMTVEEAEELINSLPDLFGEEAWESAEEQGGHGELLMKLKALSVMDRSALEQATINSQLGASGFWEQMCRVIHVFQPDDAVSAAFTELAAMLLLRLAGGGDVLRHVPMKAQISNLAAFKHALCECSVPEHNLILSCVLDVATNMLTHVSEGCAKGTKHMLASWVSIPTVKDLLDIEAFVYSWKGALEAAHEAQLTFAVGYFCDALRKVVESHQKANDHATLDAVQLKIADVLCSRVMQAQEDGAVTAYSQPLIQKMLGLLVWITTQTKRSGCSACAKLGAGAVWKSMRSYGDGHVLLRILDIMPHPTEDCHGILGTTYEVLARFLLRAAPVFNAFDKRCAQLGLIGIQWRNLNISTTAAAVGLNETMKDFSAKIFPGENLDSRNLLLPGYLDLMVDGGKNYAPDLRAKLLRTFASFERTKLLDMFEVHRTFPFWEGLPSAHIAAKGTVFLANYQMSYVFMKRADKFAGLSRLPLAVDLLSENGPQNMATLHNVFVKYCKAQMQSIEERTFNTLQEKMAQRLNSIEIIISLDSVFDMLMGNLGIWPDIQDVALLLASFLQIVTPEGKRYPKLAAEVRKAWVQKPGRVVSLVKTATALLDSLPELSDSQKANRMVMYAFNLMAARLQALQTEVSQLKATSVLRGMMEDLSAAKEISPELAEIGIIPSDMLPRMLDPHPEGHALQHLRKVAMMAFNAYMHAAKAPVEAPHSRQAGGDAGGEENAEAKAAAKAAKKERQKQKREQSLLAAGQAAPSNATPASPTPHPASARKTPPTDATTPEADDATPEAASARSQAAASTPEATATSPEGAAATPEATSATPEVATFPPEATAATPGAVLPDLKTSLASEASSSQLEASAPSSQPVPPPQEDGAAQNEQTREEGDYLPGDAPMPAHEKVTAAAARSVSPEADAVPRSRRSEPDSPGWSTAQSKRKARAPLAGREPAPRGSWLDDRLRDGTEEAAQAVRDHGARHGGAQASDRVVGQEHRNGLRGGADQEGGVQRAGGGVDGLHSKWEPAVDGEGRVSSGAPEGSQSGSGGTHQEPEPSFLDQLLGGVEGLEPEQAPGEPVHRKPRGRRKQKGAGGQGPTLPPHQVPAEGSAAPLHPSHSLGGVTSAGLPASELEELLCCPISQELMADAVVAEDGFSYDRSSIQAWFDLGRRTSPCTNETISVNLYPNHAVRQAVKLLQSFAIQ